MMHPPHLRVSSLVGGDALCTLLLGSCSLASWTWVLFGEQPMKKSAPENRDIWLVLPTAWVTLNDLQQEKALKHAHSALPG